MKIKRAAALLRSVYVSESGNREVTTDERSQLATVEKLMGEIRPLVV